MRAAPLPRYHQASPRGKSAFGAPRHERSASAGSAASLWSHFSFLQNYASDREYDRRTEASHGSFSFMEGYDDDGHSVGSQSCGDELSQHGRSTGSLPQLPPPLPNAGLTSTGLRTLVESSRVSAREYRSSSNARAPA